MPIVISDGLVLGTVANPTGTPIFLWLNDATLFEALDSTGNVEVSDADFPAVNLRNPATNLRWQANAAYIGGDIYVTASLDGLEDVDAMGIAVHNLGTGRNIISVQGTTNIVGGSPSPNWTELIAESMQANDDPLLFRWEPQTLTGVRLKIASAQSPVTSIPAIGVMYIGKLLVLERGTHTDHSPINLNRQTKTLTSRSESGQFLGRIVTSSGAETCLALKFIRSLFYREQMEPFVRAARTGPFFMAWRPEAFPNDVGYCWLTEDPQPVMHFDTGRFALTLQMSGVGPIES